MPEGPLGGPRPLADTQDVWFNASISVNKSPDETFTPDNTRYRQMISTFIENLLSQQPELDAAGGDIFILTDQWAILANDSMMAYESAIRLNRDIVSVRDTVEIDMRFEEPVLVASHVGDAERITGSSFDRFSLSDFRILPRGLLRDQRDRMVEQEEIDIELPMSTFL